MIARAMIMAAFAAGLIAHDAASADAPAPLATSYSEETGDQLPMWITLDGGYFKKYGLDVSERFLPAQQGVPALLTGQVQMASLGAADALAAAAQGVSLKYVAAHAPPLQFQLWARPEYGSAAKLKGQTVVVPSTTGSAYVATVLALRQIGLSPRDVIITPLGGAQNTYAAFTAGSAAATVANPPVTFRYRALGDVLLTDIAQQKIPNAVAGLVVLASYIPSHRAIVRDAVAAFSEGLTREKTDKDFAEQELRKHLHIADPVVLDETYEFLARPIVERWPIPETAMLAGPQSVLGAQNPKVKAVELDTMIDQSFVKTLMVLDKGATP